MTVLVQFVLRWIKLLVLWSLTASCIPSTQTDAIVYGKIVEFFDLAEINDELRYQTVGRLDVIPFFVVCQETRLDSVARAEFLVWVSSEGFVDNIQISAVTGTDSDARQSIKNLVRCKQNLGFVSGKRVGVLRQLTIVGGELIELDRLRCNDPEIRC